MLVHDLAAFGKAKLHRIIERREAVGAYEPVLFAHAVDIFADDAGGLVLAAFLIGPRLDLKPLCSACFTTPAVSALCLRPDPNSDFHKDKRAILSYPHLCVSLIACRLARNLCRM